MSRFSTEDDVLCIAHHPELPHFAVSLVTGHVHAYAYTPGNLADRKQLWSTKRHKKACRAITYSLTGDHLVSAGADGVIKLASSETGKVLRKWTDAHSETINTVSFVNAETFCTADDGGSIKAWTVSAASATREYLTHDDYVSSLLPLEGKFVASTSGDGTLAIHDLRNNQFTNDEARAQKDGWRRISAACTRRSDDQEDDLLCAVLLSRGKRDKLVVGTSGGVILAFDRKDVGDCNDRILPPPPLTTTKGSRKKKKSEEEEIGVESMAKINDSQIVVGGSDGAVRLLQVLPNQYLRLIGSFESGEPVEGVVVHDGFVIAVCGTEIQSWPLEEAEAIEAEQVKSEEGSDEQDSDDQEDDESDKEEIQSNGTTLKHVKREIKDEESDGDQFSDSDSDADAAPKRKKPKKVKPVMTGKKNTFFDDL